MKNLMRNGAFFLGVVYIAFLVGTAYAVVGDVVCEIEEVGEVFDWWFPLAILALTGIPFALGFVAGNENY